MLKELFLAHKHVNKFLQKFNIWDCIKSFKESIMLKHSPSDTDGERTTAAAFVGLAV